MACTKAPNPGRSQLGLTLLELMLVVALVGILAAMSLSYGGDFMRQQNLKEAALSSMQALQEARAAALRQAVKTAVYFAADSTVTAFIDSNGSFTPDAGEKVILKYNPGSTYGTAITVPGLATAASMNKPTVAFDHQGYSQNALGQPVATVVCIKNPRLVDVRAVELAISGAMRIQSYDSGKMLCP